MAGETRALPSSAHDPTDPTDATVGATLAATAARLPHADALASRDQGMKFTYRELDSCVDELAAVLLEGGLLPGDRVAIWSPCCAEWFLLQFAVARIGAVLVPIPPGCDSAELEHVLGDSGCRTLFGARAGRGTDPRAVVDEMRPRLPSLEHVVHLGSTEWDQLRGAGRRAGTRTLRRREATLSAGDATALRYVVPPTGTGAVTLTHSELIAEATRDAAPVAAEAQRVELTTDTGDAWRMVTASVGAAASGACVVVLPASPTASSL